MRILICGSRSWVDPAAVEILLKEKQYQSGLRGEEFVVIHGHCPDGADFLADRIALAMGLVPGEDLIREPAQWKRYGRAAGPRRNQKMLDVHAPDEVHAFRSNGKSNGTDDMLARAKKAGVPAFVHRVPPVRVTPEA